MTAVITSSQTRNGPTSQMGGFDSLSWGPTVAYTDQTIIIYGPASPALNNVFVDVWPDLPWIPQYREVTHWNPRGEPPPRGWPFGLMEGRSSPPRLVLYAGQYHRANRRVASRWARRHVNGPLKPGSKRR